MKSPMKTMQESPSTIVTMETTSGFRARIAIPMLMIENTDSPRMKSS